MNQTISTLIAAVLLCAVSVTYVYAEEKKVMNLSNKEKVIALLNSIETGDPLPVSYINANQYTQHNVAIGDGLAGFGALLQALPKGSAKVNVIRAFADGDFVFTHTDYEFFGPKVGFDVFRFEEGLIVEHWDNLTEKSSVRNPSGRSQLDGATQVTDFDQTEKNKNIVKDFIDKVLINEKFDQLTQFISTETYLQHNSHIADGLDGLGQAIEALAKQGIHMVYSVNHRVLGEGNFVLAISEGTFGNDAVAYYDLFRLSQGKIVEHWDVIEPILPKSEWKNNNGKFGGL